jgi:tetratricopeptide (TPR) repeat protein
MSPGSAASRAPIAGLLVLITVLAYLPALRNGFVWDDDHYVTDNLELRTPAGLASIWFTPTSASHLYHQYYPLVHTTYWLEYQLWALDPLGYHLVNVLLHALCSVLLWRVLTALQVPGALFAALVFAVHPVQVESVAWITERKNVLSGVFQLASGLAWLRFAGLDAQRKDAEGRWHWYWAALALFAGALLSKTVACTLPVAALILLWWKRGRVRLRDAALLVPFVVLGLALGLTTVWLEQTSVGAVGAEWDLSLAERVLVAARALWFYAAKLAWPSRLTFIYPRWDIAVGVWWQWMFVAASLAALVALWLARRRVGRGPLAAALIFVVTLSPALGFVNVYPMRYSFVADHFQYLASASPIALGAAAAAWAARRSSFPLQAILAATVLVLLGTLTWRQELAYENSDTLWQDTLAKNPQCWLAHNNLGQSLAQRGMLQEAIGHFEQSLRFNPRYDNAHNNLGTAQIRTGHLDDGIGHLEQALLINPRYAEAHSNLGNALMLSGKPELALAHFEQALALQPDLPQLRSRLGLALAADGRWQEALGVLQQDLLARPQDPLARRVYAAVLRDSGDVAGAIAACGEVLRLLPDDVPTLNDLAWMLATAADDRLRDGPRAVALAERALQLAGRQPIGLQTLAAAYAESGRFEEAVVTAQQALALATAARQDAITSVLALQLEQFRSGHALRDAGTRPELRAPDR